MDHRDTEPQRRGEDTDNRRERKDRSRNAFDTNFTNLHELLKLVPIRAIRVKSFAQVSYCVFASLRLCVSTGALVRLCLKQSRKAAKQQAGTLLTTDYTDYTDAIYLCHPCNPWSKSFPPCDQIRLLHCREQRQKRQNHGWTKPRKPRRKGPLSLILPGDDSLFPLCLRVSVVNMRIAALVRAFVDTVCLRC